MRAPAPEDFPSRLRSAAVAARIGLWLGICFGVCFLTGLVSHYAQNVSQPVPFPTSPSWGYRVNQGLHVITGTAAVPLLLVKLWTVYPRLFRQMPRDRVRRFAVEALERSSIAVLVAAAIFQLSTGLINTTQWYPWGFSFRTTHYAVAWIAVGALLLHIAVKLPIIRDVLRNDVDSTVRDRPTATSPGVLSRRGLLRTTWVAAGVAVLATAGQTVPLLRKVSVFGVTDAEEQSGVPVNRTAEEASVEDAATDPSYSLEIVNGDDRTTLTRQDLEGLPQQTETLPIACVEGWSANGSWTGVRVRDLLELVDAPPRSTLRVSSLEPAGAFRETVLQDDFTADDRTLLALALNDEPLSVDHGYPCRLIAPNRPGVLQTKWVARLEVLT